MFSAFEDRDGSYDGVFFTAVQTTGIFCRPSCPARKPNRENVEFYPSARDALLAGFKPCKRCRPMEPSGQPPSWLGPLLTELDKQPTKRLTDQDLRTMALDPSSVRRWFRTNHGMTFHAYQRARRLGLALGQIREGADISAAAYDHGYESLSGFRDAFAKFFGDAPGRSRAATLVSMTRVLTPLGPMVAGATDEGICLLEFADRRMLETQINRLRKYLDCSFAPGSNDHIAHLDEELRQYFDGRLTRFTVLTVVPGTDFQRAVWQQLLTIPYGRTRSYEEQARAIGRPSARRAVGRANGDNRIAIVIPCHRVVASNGTLCGYGGGLWRKQHLLDHERRHT